MLKKILTVALLATSVIPVAQAQLTGHAYAIISVGTSLFFRQVCPKEKPEKVSSIVGDPANIMATLNQIPDWLWQGLIVAYLYKSAFKRSRDVRSNLSSYLTPLIPTIGGLLLGTLTVAILDQYVKN